jgi:hypothetical protein
MKIPSLVRLPKHRTFNFTPRFYDEGKERIAHLQAQLEAEKRENEKNELENTDNQAFKSAIKFDRNFAAARRKSANVSLSVLRVLMLFLTIACVVAYLKLDGFENYVLGFLGFLILGYAYLLRKFNT